MSPRSIKILRESNTSRSFLMGDDEGEAFIPFILGFLQWGALLSCPNCKGHADMTQPLRSIEE